MNFFKKKYFRVRLSGKEIEFAYGKAQKELDSDEFPTGLMAQAKVKSKGDKSQAEIIFLDLRAEQILKEKLKGHQIHNQQQLKGKAKKQFNQALSYYNNNNFKLAIEKLEKANKLQPNNRIILISLAYNYSKIQDFPSTVDYMERAILSGYENFDRIQTHEDFSELRKTELFREFVENGYRQKPE